ncbi:MULTISPECIES: DUF2273 domain-containing protein [Paenibacillus]|uniref:DUF2273 domain-containing protein n=1 Tax=Paenibacillus TaxID=44249 RepID=UPI00038FE6D0|nr:MULTISPECIES: DUF2273 domain-containing protein [Paenibacillus]ASS65039.1 DUF2273 domain-containing protein [Paenibacillus sp. RUD330]KKC46181.1 hypothetical protein VE23_02170 [Paenibacillus sp. D9]CDN43881.1 Uncharacterized protein BN871_DS_00260 [Paenibacillus sp. P22]SIQ50699.1 Uncharacterized membrane protein [Paenibacillus sp. RU4X]SIQ72725.1 Uncharacterized membrane protein [Paenibacillus sp. RU4T]
MWREWWERYGGRAVGVAASLFLGIIFLISGFWDMLFVALLLWAGYTAGYRKDTGGEPLFPWRRLAEWLGERFQRYR